MQSPIPLYRQLSGILAERISSGAYPPGHKIPSENELSMEYKIGRPTVRQAMQALCQKGLVSKQKGRGTFVKEKTEAIDLFSLAGTSQAFLAKGITPVIRIIDKPSIRKIEGIADTDNSVDQNPFAGKEAACFSRLVLVKKNPVIFEEFFLSATAFPGIIQSDFAKYSLAGIIQERYFMVPETCRQSFIIAVPPTSVKSHLCPENDINNKPDKIQTSARAPGQVLLVHRILSFPHAPDAIYSRIWCRTDRFTFSQYLRGVYGQ